MDESGCPIENNEELNGPIDDKKPWTSIALVVALVLALVYRFYFGGGLQLPAAVRGLFAEELSLGMRISFILWVLFSIYWSYAAKDSASTKSSESKGSRLLHLVLVNVALVLLLFPVSGMTHRFLPANLFWLSLGLAIQTLFFFFAVWARRKLGSNWSGEVRVATGHQLIRSGPYRFVRHPIYTAVLGMYVGTAVISGEVHALLAIVLVVVAYVRKIALEDKILREAFGAEFDEYRSQTWAWIPGMY